MAREPGGARVSCIAVGVFLTLCCAASVAQGDDTLRVHATELWGAWMAVIVLVFVLSSARHVLKPIGRSAVPILLRGIVAVCYGLPLIAVLYGQWVFPEDPSPPMVQRVFESERIWTLVHIIVGTAFLSASVFLRSAILGAAFFSALGWVNHAQFPLAIHPPTGSLWAQKLGHVGFLLAFVACVVVLLTSRAPQRPVTGRDMLISRLRARSTALALALSVMPGLGWLYATRWRGGYGWFLLFLCTPLAAYVVFVPLWQQILFRGSPHAWVGSLFFLLSYVAAFTASAAMAYVAASRTGRLA